MPYECNPLLYYMVSKTPKHILKLLITSLPGAHTDVVVTANMTGRQQPLAVFFVNDILT